MWCDTRDDKATGALTMRGEFTLADAPAGASPSEWQLDSNEGNAESSAALKHKPRPVSSAKPRVMTSQSSDHFPKTHLKTAQNCAKHYKKQVVRAVFALMSHSPAMLHIRITFHIREG